MIDAQEFPVPGVRGLEHTADVGLELRAPDLPELFRRAALGAMWLVLERDAGAEGEGGERGPGHEPTRKDDRPQGPPAETRSLNLVEEDLPSLLRAWLRSLLFWEDADGFVTQSVTMAFSPAPLCSSPDGQAFGLQARVQGRRDAGPRVREIKGVTLHHLRLEREGEGWYGRVIFDV